MKALIVLVSYHNHNTEKIAKAMADVLNAEILVPEQVIIEKLENYDMMGFGSGIYDAKHHPSLLALAEKIPSVTSNKAFIFSTCGVPAIGFTKDLVAENHLPLRERLQSKGYSIVDEFSCVGHNTNSFLRMFKGINKGRPNIEDLKNAEEFAKRLQV